MAQKTRKSKRPQPKPDGYVFGRPTEYRPEYCEQLIEHMKQKSFESFANHTKPRVTIRTLYSWLDSQPDFFQAKEKGMANNLEFSETLLVRNMETGKGGFNAIRYWLEQRHRKLYQQKVDVNVVTNNINDIVARATPEQLAQIVTAIEQKTLELEASNESESTKS